MIKLVKALSATLNNKCEGKTFKDKKGDLLKLSGTLKSKEDLAGMIAPGSREGRWFPSTRGSRVKDV